METKYKKMYSFKVSEDELELFRSGMRLAIKSKEAFSLDEYVRVLARLNKLAEGTHEYERYY
jgi:hypothetical protein